MTDPAAVAAYVDHAAPLIGLSLTAVPCPSASR